MIEPANVRLVTSADDRYASGVLPEKRHLSRKQISKNSIGAYRELCREIGVFFEAVSVIESGALSRNEAFERSPVCLLCHYHLGTIDEIHS